MKNFRTLLTAQLVAALLLILILLVSFLFYSKALLNQQEAQAKNIIEQIITTHVTADGKSLSRQLDRSFALKSLQVSRLDGTILYEQNNSAESGSLMRSMLRFVGKTPQSITLQEE